MRGIYLKLSRVVLLLRSSRIVFSCTAPKPDGAKGRTRRAGENDTSEILRRNWVKLSRQWRIFCFSPGCV